MSAQPLISVILPVYNGASTVAAAVHSILGQDDGHFELLVLDDGSTDTSAAEARRAAEGDRRVRILDRMHRGIVATLRDGCAAARGDFIARMDADDIAHPRRLSAQRAWFRQHPQGGLCGTQVRMVGEEVGIGRIRYGDWLNGLTDHTHIERDLFIECPVAHPTFMARRKALEGVGGYRAFAGPEDYDLVFRLWHAGYRLGNVDRPLLDWYESNGRLSRQSPRYRESAFRALKREWLRVLYGANGRPWYQWGAGEVGKRWLREWPVGGIQAVVDIRPGKIGQRIHGVPVIPPEDLPPAGELFFVIAVGTPGARDIIRAWCTGHGYRECVDYRFVA